MTAVTTPDRLRGMTAISRDSDIEPLGFIVWFSVPDEPLKLNRLKRRWILAGLDPRVLPEDQKAVNAFKRAVRDQEGIRRHEQNGTVTETDVRELDENAEQVVYQISRVVRDLDNRVVEYPKALQAIFVKKGGEIKFRALDLQPKELLPIMEAIRESYEANGKTVTGAKVRSLVRSYIKDDFDERDNLAGLSGENLRGKAGGVYFVLAKFEDQLQSLSEMLHELYLPAGRAYLYSVPLADGASERELIRRHHSMNSIEDMKEAMADVAKLLRPVNPGDPEARDRAPRRDVIAWHFRRLERFRRHAAQYNDALKEEQGQVSSQLEILHKQLRKLVNL